MLKQCSKMRWTFINPTMGKISRRSSNINISVHIKTYIHKKNYISKVQICTFNFSFLSIHKLKDLQFSGQWKEKLQIDITSTPFLFFVPVSLVEHLRKLQRAPAPVLSMTTLTLQVSDDIIYGVYSV